MKNGKAIRPNGQYICPPYDGPCDYNGKCTSGCKRNHKKIGNRKRRTWNKKKLREEILFL